jgi:Rha family phage regulatory protein
LRDIEAILGGSPKLGNQFLFRKTSYVDGRGKTYPMYEMNEDAFVVVAMAFTGQEAFRLRVAFIVEFKRMQRALAGTQFEQVPPDFNDPGVLRAHLISYTEKLQASQEETRQVRLEAQLKIAAADALVGWMAPAQLVAVWHADFRRPLLGQGEG